MERVDLTPFVVLVLRVRVRRLVRDRHAARPERDAEVRVRGQRPDARRRQIGVRVWPRDLAVQLHLVRVLGARLEVVDADERVVVPLDAEGGLGEAENLDLARLVGLDPDGRLALVRVAEQRTY